ncbi:MAG: hypothetical protein JWP88_2225 [Flaviaesturariibacter sp.]|nr:hypothetical protein [Flaviaesturariibacter sp.]
MFDLYRHMTASSRSFAIGDIHGCNRTFGALLQKMALKPDDTLYCLGDYIDRGPDSKGVIDTILGLRQQGITVRTLRGNHEQMLLDAAADWLLSGQWLSNGGRETLKSFGIKRISDLPPAYLDFMKQTEYFILTPGYVLVHAGLNFEEADPFTDQHAMLWTRDTFMNEQKLGGRTLVHGHTPTPLLTITKQLNSNRINLDGGCVYAMHEGYGNLLALNLDTRELLIQKVCG